MHSADELLVWDQTDDCPYLPGRTSRMPLRMPLGKLSGEELDQRLAQGDRRSGPYLYTPNCPGCAACQPLRLDIQAFQPSRTQARAFKRGEQMFRTELGPPQADTERVALFNRHKLGRGLSDDGYAIDETEYRAFLTESCCETREIAYYLEDCLAMVAIIDCGATGLSAVYTYFDPALARLSPGVYSVLKEVELCRAWHRRYLYLGYYVAGSQHMAYKAGYHPHERRIAGRWQQFA